MCFCWYFNFLYVLFLILNSYFIIRINFLDSIFILSFVSIFWKPTHYITNLLSSNALRGTASQLNFQHRIYLDWYRKSTKRCHRLGSKEIKSPLFFVFCFTVFSWQVFHFYGILLCNKCCATDVARKESYATQG